MAQRNRRHNTPVKGPAVAAGVALGAYVLAHALVRVLGLSMPSVVFPVARTLAEVYFLGGPVLAGVAGFQAGRRGDDVDTGFLRGFAGIGAAGYAVGSLVGVVVLLTTPFTTVPILEHALTTFSPAFLFVSTAILGGFLGSALASTGGTGRTTPGREREHLDATGDLDGHTAEAIDRLRERYADGEMTEAELERRIENVLEAGEGAGEVEADVDSELDVELDVEEGDDSFETDVEDLEARLDTDDAGGTPGDDDGDTDRDREPELN